MTLELIPCAKQREIQPKINAIQPEAETTPIVQTQSQTQSQTQTQTQKNQNYTIRFSSWSTAGLAIESLVRKKKRKKNKNKKFRFVNPTKLFIIIICIQNIMIHFSFHLFRSYSKYIFLHLLLVKKKREMGTSFLDFR